MTDQPMPPPRSASSSTPSATSTAASSRATARSPTTATWPTATARSSPPWASRSTPTCSPSPSRPQFVDVNTPFRRDRRWGGDNTDAYYALCPVDPTRRYRISGNRGDSVYFSVTAYNEPAPGTWSDKVVAIVNDTDIEYDADGELHVRPRAAPRGRRPRHPGLPGRPADGAPDRLGDRGATTTPSRSGTARTRRPRPSARAPPGCGRCSRSSRSPSACGATTSTRSATRSPSVANDFGEPYQVGDANFGWSARDASYSFGSFVLEDDEALVITYRPPSCRFWNFVVWNQFMATHSAGDDRCSINGTQAVPNADGTVTIVVSKRRLDHPNARVDGRLPPRQPGLPLVPGRRGPGQARGPAGEGRRRPDRRVLVSAA